jgi:hypothetical protein
MAGIHTAAKVTNMAGMIRDWAAQIILGGMMATCHIKRSLGAPFAMDIIIIMCWSIWVE